MQEPPFPTFFLALLSSKHILALSLELCFQDAIPFVAQSLKHCSHNAFPKPKSTVRLNTAVILHPGSIFSLRVQFIKVGKLRKQVLEAVGHIVFPIRKQSAKNTRCCSALFCYLCGPESQPQDGATHSGWVFQTQRYEKTLPQACPEDHSPAASRVCKLLALIIRVKLVCMIVV